MFVVDTRSLIRTISADPAWPIFPIYVLHQTIMVLVGYWLLGTGWPVGFKYAILIISTLLVFVLMYEGVIKRLGRAGILFGLKT